MPWFWIAFLIIGTLGAILYCNLDDNNKSSKSTSHIQKEKSIDEMIKELEQSIDLSKDKNTSQNQQVVTSQTIDYMPVEPSKYTVDMNGHRLVHYNGDEDVLFVPFGIGIIGNDESQIKDGKKWDCVYIPKSVHTIHDLALPFVESVYYEGSAEEFGKIDIGTLSNFMTGFIPNYVENMAPQYIEHSKVEEVKFQYNTNLRDLYQTVAEKRKKEDFCVKRTRDFVILCREIDKLGNGYGFCVYKEGSPPTFYVKHTFHDVDYLLFAHDSLQKGDMQMVKHYYEKIINSLPTTINRRDFFLYDFSDFCDFLRGGLSMGIFRYNKFTRDGCNDIIIEQNVGSCTNIESEKTYVALKKEIENLTK